MALTRIGENCTAVVTMDPGQCDIHYNDSCIHELNRFESAESIAVVRFSQAQVVRSEIVKTILGCYND
jgi:phosphate starvation-inducible protein PhoH